MPKKTIKAEDIRQRAYELWEQGDQVHGHDVDHWLLAEQELAAVRPRASGGRTRKAAGSQDGAAAGTTAKRVRAA